MSPVSLTSTLPRDMYLERDSNPHGHFCPLDFKSSVSTIPPPRQVILFWADGGTRTPVGLFVSGLQNQCCRHWATSAYNGGKSKEWFYWRTWTFKSLFLRQMCIPFHEVTLLITIHYFVALVGNDPTTFSMSKKCSPIELQGIVFWASCQTRTGVPGLQIQNNQPTIRRMRLRYWLGSNQCDRFCRSVPLVFRHHSATVPYFCWNNETRTHNLSRIRRML